MTKDKLITIVVPMYNEQEGAQHFNEILGDSLAKIPTYRFEILYVNDGSTDDTLLILQAMAKKDKKIKVINLSRNFGKEIATTAGINNANGDAILIMDGDGQHPPELVVAFIEKWEAGADVVVGVRNKNHKEGLVKRLGSLFFYKLFNALSGTALVPRSTDFRLIDKSVQAEFSKFTERNRITRGLIDWLGFRRDYIYYNSPARLAGEASYKTSQLVQLALNSFISLSLKPLFFFGWLGLFIMITSVLIGSFILVEQIILSDPLGLRFTGTAMLGIFISFLVSLVLMSQAVIAIYLSHIYDQTRNRPLYVIDQKNSSYL